MESSIRENAMHGSEVMTTQGGSEESHAEICIFPMAKEGRARRDTTAGMPFQKYSVLRLDCQTDFLSLIEFGKQNFIFDQVVVSNEIIRPILEIKKQRGYGFSSVENAPSWGFM